MASQVQPRNDIVAAFESHVQIAIAKATKNIFTMLSVKPDEAMMRDFHHLFGAKENTIDLTTSSPATRVKRFVLLLEIYRLWMRRRRRSGTVRDAFSIGVPGGYNYGALLRDFRFVTDNEGLLSEELGLAECPAADCFILARSERERGGGRARGPSAPARADRSRHGASHLPPSPGRPRP